MFVGVCCVCVWCLMCVAVLDGGVVCAFVCLRV